MTRGHSDSPYALRLTPYALRLTPFTFRVGAETRQLLDSTGHTIGQCWSIETLADWVCSCTGIGQNRLASKARDGKLSKAELILCNLGT